MLSNFRLADYRLAAYVVFAALIAGGATFAFDRLTAPSQKLSANGAPASSGAVRQIPIARTTAADIGDPDGKLTPVYPTSPGKDLPIKDTPIRPTSSTTGSAGGQAASPAAATAPPVASAAAASAMASPVAAATAAPANACNVAACASAYRSFREADCSYQPFEGPRRYCEGAPDPNAPNGQVAAQPPAQPARSIPRGRSDSELRDVERTVRRLPPPSAVTGDDDEDSIVVMQPPDRSRYELRRNWFNEQ